MGTLWVLLTLARSLPAQAVEGGVGGVVTDLESGRPLAGAVVLMQGTRFRGLTANDGRYLITGVARGQYVLQIALVGYLEAKSDVDVLPGAIAQVDFALPKAIVEIPGVVVTASRAEEHAGDSPASVAVVTHDAVVRRSAITIDQALPFVPGVIFNNGQVDIRGASGVAGGVGSRVLILLDGKPILTGDGGEVDFNAVPMLDLDRVEVVKGAYSALYGSNALGGVVNVITTPIDPAPETVVAAHYGFYDTPADVRFTTRALTTEDVDVQHSRRFGELGARLAVRTEHSDGFEEDGQLDRWMVRTKLAWPANEANASSAYAMFTSEDDGNHFVWRSDSEPYAVDPASATDWSRAQKLFLGAAVNAVTTASVRLQVNPYLFYNTLQNHFHNSPDSTDYHRAMRIGTNLQVTVNPWPTHVLTAGAEAARTGVVSNFLLVPKSGAQPVLGDGALYAEDAVALSDRLRATMGARLDLHQATGGPTEYSVSPKLGAVFKIASVVSARVSIGHGFRAPSAIEQFVNTTQQGFHVIPNADLKSETAWSGEFGATATAGGWVWFDGAVFQSEYHRLIAPGVVLDTLTDSLAFQFKNVQEARVRGLDAAGKVGLLRGAVGLEATYTYLDSKDLATGKPLPYRSRHNLTASLTALGGLFGLDVRYRSRIDEVLVYPLDPRGPITIVDLRLGYRVFGTGVQAKVSNLFQAAYVDVMERNRGAPRSFLFSAYRTM